MSETEKKIQEQQPETNEQKPEDPAKKIEKLEAALKEKDETIKHLKAQVEEAAEVISGIQKDREAADTQEKQRLIYRLNRDSRGFLRKDHLSALDLQDLYLIEKVFDSENARDYLEYFEKRRAEVDSGKRAPGLTVGEYDQKTKTWKES